MNEFPTIQQHIAERIRAKCQREDTEMRRAASPHLSYGYQIEELEAVYKRDWSKPDPFIFTGVRVKEHRPELVLTLRRLWRFFFPYDLAKGDA